MESAQVVVHTLVRCPASNGWDIDKVDGRLGYLGKPFQESPTHCEGDALAEVDGGVTRKLGRGQV